jgi:PAS domain S-box-containing protein
LGPLAERQSVSAARPRLDRPELSEARGKFEGRVEPKRCRVRWRSGAEREKAFQCVIRVRPRGNAPIHNSLFYKDMPCYYNRTIQFVSPETSQNTIEEETLQIPENELTRCVEERTAELSRINEQLEKEIEGRRKAEEAIRQKESIFAAAQRIAHLGSYEWNLTTDDLVGSDEAYRIVGHEQGSEVGFGQIKRMIHPEDLEHVLEVIRRAVQTFPGREEVDCRIRRDDGQERSIHIRGEVVFDEDENPMRIIGIVQDITERKAAEEALRRSEAALLENRNELRRLAGKLLSAEEEERRRVAREVHNDFTRRLAHMAVEAGKLEQQLRQADRALADKMQQFRKQMMLLSADVYRLSRRLHPSVLEEQGLVKAVRKECAHYTHHEGIDVRFVPLAVPETLADETALCLYRIIQEGLRNIARHAGAKRAKVTLLGEENLMRLSIEDDGAGFDPALISARDGFGLISIGERVRLVQGRLSIDSGPGQGTVINVEVPLLSGEYPGQHRASPELSQRQKEVLQLLSQGRSAKEIAVILSISTRTVEFHKYRMMEYLGIKTSAELVRYAVGQGLAST